MNIKNELEAVFGSNDAVYLNDIELDPQTIKAVLINEVVPADPQNDFYNSVNADYAKTTILLFQKAGLAVISIQELIDQGIYITNAVKTPKFGYEIGKEQLENSLSYLETELSLFPNLKVILLMGDVAKKGFNKLSRKTIGKAVIPSGSTYKIRRDAFYYNSIRIMPSYIMTGGNLLIEKSKVAMVAEDIAVMLDLIQQ